MPELLTSEMVKRGDHPCQTCGNVHNAYRVANDPKRWGSWADPDDGHAYHRESDEALLNRYIAEYGPLPYPIAPGR